MTYRVILGHPFGNANVRQALIALYSHDMLAAFVTTICAEHIWFRQFLPERIRREIDRRRFDGVPDSLISSHPYQEALRLFGKRYGNTLSRIGLGHLSPTTDEVWASFDESLSSYARRRDLRDVAIYAYEDGALRTFSLLTPSRKIYELPIGYWRRMHTLMEEERTLAPEWSATLSGLSDSPEKLERKDRELQLADAVLVPSEFVRDTLPPLFLEKARVVPYGCPRPVTSSSLSHSNGGPLKILFCGSLGQRKGISYFFKAMEMMGAHVDVTVIGAEVAKCSSLSAALSGVKWYRSLPHQEVLEQMRTNDVFVFPTIFEGRALVVLEALSQGMPVITTINSGASDVVIDGVSGFVVPIRSPVAICEALERLYADRGLLSWMKEQALSVAARSGWSHYRAQLVTAVQRPTGVPADSTRKCLG